MSWLDDYRKEREARAKSTEGRRKKRAGLVAQRRVVGLLGGRGNPGQGFSGINLGPGWVIKFSDGTFSRVRSRGPAERVPKIITATRYETENSARIALGRLGGDGEVLFTEGGKP